MEKALPPPHCASPSILCPAEASSFLKWKGDCPPTSDRSPPGPQTQAAPALQLRHPPPPFLPTMALSQVALLPGGGRWALAPPAHCPLSRQERAWLLPVCSFYFFPLSPIRAGGLHEVLVSLVKAIPPVQGDVLSTRDRGACGSLGGGLPYKRGHASCTEGTAFRVGVRCATTQGSGCRGL